MTPAATRFVGAAPLRGNRRRARADRRVRPRPGARRLPRRAGARARSDLPPRAGRARRRLIVAPASANTIAKLAAGICDSLLTTSFLACAAPRIVAPAMNDRMYEDAATQANVATLRERGVTVIEPDDGAAGLARRARHRAAARARGSCSPRVEAAAPPAPRRPWDGLRVLVTAGGTREPIDPVRFIGNRSSGRMGFALAAAAARRGADVTLIAANVSLPTPAGVERIDVEQRRRARRAPPSAAFDSCRRAADGRRRRRLPAQRPRADGKLVRRAPAVSSWARANRRRARRAAAAPRAGQTLVGFAAEHGGGFVARARASSSARASTRSSSTTSPTRRSASTARQRGHDRRRGGECRLGRAQGDGRGRDPRPGRGARRRAVDAAPRARTDSSGRA